tara:strand:+ start:49315 stop:50013 length:699 start_codon:yes stop_codon:yes gene_type:complete
MKGQPFFFDSNIFDDDHQLSEEERAAEPEFTRDELAQAKTSSFEEGKRAGFKESEDSITNKMHTILQTIERNMAVLFAAEETRNKTYENEAVHLSAAIFQKAFPEYMKAYGHEELKASITDALSHHMTPEKINIQLNDALLGALSDFLKAQENTLQKQITIKADNTLADHDCRIDWPSGGVICNHETTTQKIFDILNQSLAERGISLHDGDKQQDTEDALTPSDQTNTSGES